MDDRELVSEAGMLLARLAPYAAARHELATARDLVFAQRYRRVGPHRAAGNVQRLRAVIDKARGLFGA